jgi:methanogenic corrinoid protein MtbC1
MSMDMFEKLAQTVIDGEPEDAAELAQQALAQGLDALDCINKGLSPGIDEVGELFATGEYYLPDLILGGDAMKAALEVSNLLWPEARTARSWGELCSAR